VTGHPATSVRSQILEHLCGQVTFSLCSSVEKLDDFCHDPEPKTRYINGLIYFKLINGYILYNEHMNHASLKIGKLLQCFIPALPIRRFLAY
jgi:hypothetical protein